MEPWRVLDELFGVAARLRIEVRITPLVPPVVGHGGLCRLRGRELIVVDEYASTTDQNAVMAEALSHFDLETVFVVPAVRRFIADAGRHPLARGSGPTGTVPRGTTRPATFRS